MILALVQIYFYYFFFLSLNVYSMPAEFFYTSLIFFHEFSSNLPISFILENIKKTNARKFLT